MSDHAAERHAVAEYLELGCRAFGEIHSARSENRAGTSAVTLRCLLAGHRDPTPGQLTLGVL